MLKRLLTAGILALLATAVHAAGMYPLSNAQQVDSNGKIMPGALLYLFDGGTTTPRIAYKDLALTTPHPNPIVVDSAGRIPLIFLADGYYRQRLTTKTGTLIFDQDGIPVLTTSAGGAGTTVDPDSTLKTGDFKIAYNSQPQSGFVRANGRTIGSAASGATERANADTQALYSLLWGYSNISVSGGKGGSAAADFAANKTLTLPDAAGRGMFGADDLGAGSQSRLNTYIANSTLMGSVGGNQAWTIQFNNLPVNSPWAASVSGPGTTALGGSHSHTYSGNTGGFSADHTHGFTFGGLPFTFAGLSFSYTTASSTATNVQYGNGTTVGGFWTGTTTATGTTSGGSGTTSGGSGTTGGSSNDHTHAYSGTTSAAADHNHTFNFSAAVAFAANSGGGQPIDKTPPLLTLMVLIRL